MSCLREFIVVECESFFLCSIPDWVYEEEMLGTDAASWISPDDKYLAFIRFDDTNVKEAVYDLYGDGEQQYPEEVHLRYPKVGNEISFPSRKRLSVYNLVGRHD